MKNKDSIAQEDDLVAVFKSLSDPTRLKLFRLLIGSGGALCVNALAHKLGVTQSAVSQHLRILRHSGLVKGLRHGYFIHYVADREYFSSFQDKIHRFFKDIDAG